MSPFATNLMLVVATCVVGLFCAGFAAAQVLSPQAIIVGILP